MSWEEAALYCNNIYGSYIDVEEQFFICPECGEPIYKEDWSIGLETCPICTFPWLDDEDEIE